MSIFPEIIAGYGAALVAVEGLDVQVREPGVHLIPTDPIEMIASGPKAYSVLLVVLPEGVNVCRHKRYGFLDEVTLVRYPVPTTAGDFGARLREALRPVVEAELATALAEKNAAVAAHGARGIEATDAVRRIG
jgi:hypothetical protein